MIKVFLSSTALDLSEEREAAKTAINQLSDHHCVHMEAFSARNDTPLEICLRELRKCSVYVAVIGHRYGSCPPGEPMSYTEAEYAEAVRLNLPRLIFVMHDEALIAANLVEPEAQRIKQAALRKSVREERVCSQFGDAQDLKHQVAISLHNLRYESKSEDSKRPGTVLLFPFVTSFHKWETGISIANTTARPINSALWSDRVTLHFYGKRLDGTRVTTEQCSGVIPAGSLLVFSLGTGGGAPYGTINSMQDFQGYVIAVCGFASARGFAMITDKAGDSPGSCYTAEVIKDE